MVGFCCAALPDSDNASCLVEPEGGVKAIFTAGIVVTFLVATFGVPCRGLGDRGILDVVSFTGVDFVPEVGDTVTLDGVLSFI